MNAESSYPYLVVRLASAVYQRELIVVRSGEPRAHIGFRDSFVHHPTPFAEDFAISPGCKDVLVAAVFDAVRRLGFRMCIVWRPDNCTFVERDGTARESMEPPSGGFGSEESTQ